MIAQRTSAAASAGPSSIDPPVSTSMALVPLSGDRTPPRAAASPRRQSTGVVFHAIWYVAAALMFTGGAAEPWIGGWVEACFFPGLLLAMIGGFGVLIWTLVRVTEAKFRAAMLAVALMIAAIVSGVRLGSAGDEIRAGGRVTALQPLADELVRSDGIRKVGIVEHGRWVEVNGYSGQSDGMLSRGGAPKELLSLAQVLRQERIPVDQYERVVAEMRDAGVLEAAADAHAWKFRTNGRDGVLLYVRPAVPIPAPGELPVISWDDGAGRARHSLPLGGGWYQVW